MNVNCDHKIKCLHYAVMALHFQHISSSKYLRWQMHYAFNQTNEAVTWAEGKRLVLNFCARLSAHSNMNNATVTSGTALVDTTNLVRERKTLLANMLLHLFSHTRKGGIKSREKRLKANMMKNFPSQLKKKLWALYCFAISIRSRCHDRGIGRKYLKMETFSNCFPSKQHNIPAAVEIHFTPLCFTTVEEKRNAIKVCTLDGVFTGSWDMMEAFAPFGFLLFNNSINAGLRDGNKRYSGGRNDVKLARCLRRHSTFVWLWFAFAARRRMKLCKNQSFLRC